jgi:hypothetical protein
MSLYTDAANWCEPIGGIRYQVSEPVSFEVGRKGSGLLVSVPEGTVFDCSIPRLLQCVLSPHDLRFLKAAALHDVLLGRQWDRVTAAAVFHDALRSDGVGRLQRLLMWMAVSLYRWQ